MTIQSSARISEAAGSELIATTLTAPISLTVVEKARPIFCHFTLSHSELKSRTFHRQCLPLAARGFQVRYVSPALEMRQCRGIDFVQFPSRKGRFTRFLQWPRLLLTLLRQRAALYHLQDPELLPLAFVLKKVFRKRVLYDAYEDFPSMALQSDSIPRRLRPLVSRAVAIIERSASSTFDGLTTADSLTLRRLAHAPRSRKLVLYNFPNLDFFPSPPESSARKEFDVVYRGGLSERAGTHILLDALRFLTEHKRPIRLLLIGYCDGPFSEISLRSKIRDLGLSSSVEWLGRIPHEQMARALSRARIGISPLLATPKFQINIPVKIFEYWACGLPVVASDLPPIWPFFRSVGAGLLFPPGDPQALALSIAWLLDHRAEAQRMGRAGRAAIVSRFNNRAEAQRFSRFCSQIIAS